jgi:HEAT repeat protein
MITFMRLIPIAVSRNSPLAGRSFAWGWPGVGRWFARSTPPWQFDWISAGVGFAAGLLVALAIYALRGRIVNVRNTLASQASSVQERLAKGAQDRYLEAVIEQAEQAHLLRHYAPLSQLYVPSPLVFSLAPLIVNRPEKGDEQSDLWRPMCMHDILYRLRPTIELGDGLRQHSRLAVLGPVGSGRTTLLAYLVQLFARHEGGRLVYGDPREDDPPELRAARAREEERLPVWLPLESLDLSAVDERDGRSLLEPIVEHLAASIRGLMARSAASSVQAQIVAGRCLFLLDNLDMLAADAQERALHWLHALMRTYPENAFVLTGAPEGYSRIQEIGFVPLMLDGFRRPQVTRFVERWEKLREQTEMAAWEAQVAQAQAALDAQVAQARKEGRPPPSEADLALPDAPEPPAGLLRIWKAGCRDQVMPLDLALAALLWREQNRVPQRPLMCYAQTVLIALDRITDNLLPPPQWARVLAATAWEMQDQARYTVSRHDLERQVSDILAQSATPKVESSAGEGDPSSEPEPPNYALMAYQAVEGLLRAGDLLIPAGRGQLAFVHPVFRTYFAAQHAARNQEGDHLLAHVHDPRWQATILLYAGLAPVTPLVMERLKGPDDLFRTNFFAAASYLAASPQADKRLQGGVLAELAQVFLNPRQATMLRRQAAAVIAGTGDKGALYLFAQALRHADPHVRRLGVWGLAQMDDETAIEGLLHTLSDQEFLVRVAALHALGSLGGERVIDGLVQGLQDEHELPRRMAAEALASIGGEGWEVLREAAQSQDVYIRRAAVYGLAAIAEPWVVSTLEHISREDPEWYVRSAATDVLEQLQSGPLVLDVPALEDEPWLVSWAARRGVGLGTRLAALRAVLDAIREEDWPVRLAAADALRVHGGSAEIEPLRAVLGDADILVHQVAYVALYEIGLRAGISIPRDDQD